MLPLSLWPLTPTARCTASAAGTAASCTHWAQCRAAAPLSSGCTNRTGNRSLAASRQPSAPSAPVGSAAPQRPASDSQGNQQQTRHSRAQQEASQQRLGAINPQQRQRYASTVDRRRAVFAAPPPQQPQQHSSDSTSSTAWSSGDGFQPLHIDTDAQRRESGSHASRSSSSSSSSSSSNSSSSRGGAAAGSPRYGAAAAPRYTAVDKHHLTNEENADVARRLRTATGPHRARPLRIYRYAIDDLRLFKALEEAGLEGRCVVSDTIEGADIAFAVLNKRSGKAVNVPAARSAATKAGVPFVVLRAVSALQIARALVPLLGPEAVAVGLEARPGSGVSEHAPRRLRADDVAGDGGDALLALLLLGSDRDTRSEGGTSSAGEMSRSREGGLGGLQLQESQDVGGRLDGSLSLASAMRLTPAPGLSPIIGAGMYYSSRSSSSGGSDNSASSSQPGTALADPLAILAAQQAPRSLAASPKGSEGDALLQRAVLDQRAARMADAPVMEWMACVDVDEDREHWVPHNPTQRVGPRLTVMRPIRHGSKLRRQRLARELAQRPEVVPW